MAAPEPNSSPVPMAAHIATAQIPGCASPSSSARSNPHSASVIASVRIASGIRIRVKRNSPTLVASTSPEYIPLRRPNAQAPNRAVTQHSSTVPSAIGIRAAQSCTPNIRNETAIIQYFSGDFSR